MASPSEPTLSPELESPYESAARQLDELIVWADANDYERTRNEATTRLHLINKLLEDCLAWPPEETAAEVSHEGTYTDYMLGRNGTAVVVEAKREGVYFELPAGFDSRTISLKTLRDTAPDVWPAIEQALNYCLTRGVPLGVVSNGHQLIAFIGSRQDGVPPADGRALVFTSLQDKRDDFTERGCPVARRT